MKVSLEISMYPLDKNFIPTIKNFIERLNQNEGVSITTNTMSTQVFGDYDVVMPIFAKELKMSFTEDKNIVVITKFFNGDLKPNELN